MNSRFWRSLSPARSVHFIALGIYFLSGTKFSWNEETDTCFNVEYMLLDRSFDFLGGYCLLPNGFYWLYERSCRPKNCNFIKKETLAQVFSCEFCKISQDTFSHRTPLVAASGYCKASGHKRCRMWLWHWFWRWRWFRTWWRWFWLKVVARH